MIAVLIDIVRSGQGIVLGSATTAAAPCAIVKQGQNWGKTCTIRRTGENPPKVTQRHMTEAEYNQCDICYETNLAGMNHFRSASVSLTSRL